MKSKLDLKVFAQPSVSTRLAEFLQREHVGACVEVYTVADYKGLRPGSVFFANAMPRNSVGSTVAIVRDDPHETIPEGQTCILSPNPMLDFCRLLQEFVPAEPWSTNNINTFIHPDAQIGENVRIGSGSVVEAGAVIGDGSVVGVNAVVKAAVTIGKNCIISDGCIVGNAGLTTVNDENGRPILFRHVGDLIVGDNVHIGPNATIGRATLGAAKIGSGVVIGPQVNIGHNGDVEKNVIITGCSCIAGGVSIGERSFLGANCSIKDKIRIGKECVIGMGASVFRDMPDGTTVSTFPAMGVRDVQAARRLFNRSRA